MNEISYCSSILKLGEMHNENYPLAREIWKEMINVNRLDDILRKENLVRNVLTKIDVQGFKDKVIHGGQEVLKQTKVIIIEMSYVPLYKGQPLFHDVYDMLFSLGFSFRGIFGEQNHRNSNGEPLYVDGVFINKYI